MTAAFILGLNLFVTCPSLQDTPDPAVLADRSFESRARSMGGSGGFLNLEWLELSPRVGMAMFSAPYEVDNTLCGSLHVRAPMGWLSPASNPDGDYFGLYVDLTVAQVERDILDDSNDGSMTVFTLGVDYTVYRDETWLVMAQAGFQYGSFGGITDLDDGMGGVFGIMTGIKLARDVSLTYNPAFTIGQDPFTIHYFGLQIEF